MDRIIIREVDNTSNVESLSSYDVAYVPGFAGPVGEGGIDTTKYRVPTLVTDKYDFIKKFGTDAPRFSSAQAYPTEFPIEAIKWGDNVGAYTEIQTNDFISIQEIVESTYYTAVENQIDSIGENTTYYQCTHEAATETEPAHYHLERIEGDTADVIKNTVNQFIGGFIANTDETPKAGTTYYIQDSQTGVYSVWNPEWATVAEGVNYYIYDSGAKTYTQIDRTTQTTPEIKTYQQGKFKVAEEFVSGSVYELNTNDGIITYTLSEDTTEDESKTYYAIDGNLTDWAPSFESGVTYFVYNEGHKYPVYMSTVNPSTIDGGWYVLVDTAYEATANTFIEDDVQYYFHRDGVPAMFEANDADPGWRYAYTLLSMGMPVYFEQMNSSEEDINVNSMYSGLNARFIGVGSVEDNKQVGYLDPDYSFDNMGDYSVKFITTGGYPIFEYANNAIAEQMLDLAKVRGDATALIDHTDNPDRPLTYYENNSVIYSMRQSSLSADDVTASHGAMFTPWYVCTHPAVALSSTSQTLPNTHMPASLAYLTALANQVQNYNPWLAVSGVTRGRVPYCDSLCTNHPLTNNIADTYQVLPSDTISSGAAVSINPITYIRNYGNCIWGNRTLRNNANGTKASSFLNIRSAVNDIKKRLFEASQQLLFEQNTDVLWLNFKSLITPLLETMKTDYIINEYALTRLTVDPNTGQAVPAYKVLAVIRIQPINSVEVFDLTVYLENVEGETLIQLDTNE